LAFDTLYAEGQRRYVESLSAYARQFLQLMDKPDVDLIEGLSPAIAIEQKATSHNPRSTVGTVTEIHDYLRLLFARAGTPYCPDHMLAAASANREPNGGCGVGIARRHAPDDRGAQSRASAKANLPKSSTQMQAPGLCALSHQRRDVRSRQTCPHLKKTEKHDIDVVVDRLKVRHEVKRPRAMHWRQRIAREL
jgi:excinuclease ABC subunit A